MAVIIITPEQEAIRELAVPMSFVRPRPDLKRVVDGRSQAPKDPSVPFEGAEQPFDPRKLRHLPEGKDARDFKVVWTETEIIIDDEVTLDAELYIVQTAEFWREGNFHEIVMLRESGTIS